MRFPIHAAFSWLAWWPIVVTAAPAPVAPQPAVPVAAAPATPEESLDDDLSGPAVNWLGEIVNVLRQGDDTCFILNRVQELDYRYAQTATRFAACSPGGFDEQTYTPGKVLAVQGNLGGEMPRLIGGQKLTVHLIAAPRLTPQPDEPTGGARYGYYGYGSPYGPYYDPFYYPGYGFGLGFHHRRHR